MRVLMVTPRSPFPPQGGDRLRLFHILRTLSQRHEVTLFTLVATREQERTALAHRSMAARIRTFFHPSYRSYGRAVAGLAQPSLPLQASYFRCRALGRALRQIPPGEFDVALGSLIRTAPYLLEMPLPVVIDVQDSISMNYRRAMPHLPWRQRLLYRLEQPRVQRYETEVVSRAAGATMISPVDLEDVQQRVPAARLVLAPNGVDGDAFCPGGEAVAPQSIVFLGNLRTVANRDMACRSVMKIMPRVRRQRPTAALRIVGINAPADLRALDGVHGATLVGAVDHPVDELRRATLTLCPMRFGAGIQNKILESLAVGTPVVASAMAAAPLGLASGRGVLVADSDEEQADACLRLMADPELRARVGRAGRREVEERFGWEACLAPLEALLQEIARG